MCVHAQAALDDAWLLNVIRNQRIISIHLMYMHTCVKVFLFPFFSHLVVMVVVVMAAGVTRLPVFPAIHFSLRPIQSKCKYLHAFVYHSIAFFIRIVLFSLFVFFITVSLPSYNFHVFNNIYLYNVTCSCTNICVSKSFSNKMWNIVRNWPQFVCARPCANVCVCMCRCVQYMYTQIDQ